MFQKKDVFLPIILILSLLLILSTSAMASTVNPRVEAIEGMVAAANPLATHAGLEMLLKGGNAIDAAVAVAFTLGVVEPNASGLGGGGFLLYFDAETEEMMVLDYREVAPLAATQDMYEDPDLPSDGKAIGHLSVGVPGQVAGLLYALENYGTMSRHEVMAPAIGYADNGFVVRPQLEGLLAARVERFQRFPGAAATWLKDGETPYQAGDILYQKDKARTLKLIADQGVDGFYRGRVAEAIAREMRENGGLITTQDLANYLEIRPRVMAPAEGTYKGYTIFSMPPPSSGGAHIVQMLNILEHFDMRALGHNTPESIHLLSEVMKLAFADRSAYMADPDFVDIPLEGITSKEYAAYLASQVNMEIPTLYPEPGDPFQFQTSHIPVYQIASAITDKESPNTTHFSIIDEMGNMVAVTNTINWFFGSHVVVPGTGIKLNNEMDDFVGFAGHANSPEPEKAPLSSMSPTLVLDPDGKPFLTIGTPGATRIFPSIMQILINIIDHGMDIQQAVEEPRVFSVSDSITLEGRISYNVVKALEEMGHIVNITEDWAPYFGAAQGIYIDYFTNKFVGGADPRRDGKVMGY